jgi:hypothetical protein
MLGCDQDSKQLSPRLLRKYFVYNPYLLIFQLMLPFVNSNPFTYNHENLKSNGIETEIRGYATIALAWASAVFFIGKGQNFIVGAQKSQKRYYFFSKIYNFGRPRPARGDKGSYWPLMLVRYITSF